MTEEAVL